jgi:glutathione peroxidase
MTAPIYAISTTHLDGAPASLGDWAGKVMLIVNVASKCGLTPQYEGLETLYRTYRDRGLTVLGFPSNDFAGQEPGTHAEIADFCRATYGVDFPMFAKRSVRGPEQDELYRLLTAAQPQRSLRATPSENALRHKDEPEVRWNFEKFLVSRSGEIVDRFDPEIEPLDPIIVEAVETELARP